MLRESAPANVSSGAPLRVGINCLRIDPSSVGGVNSYTLGLLQGFANVGNGCRFRLYVTPANRHLFEEFRQRANFEVIVIKDRFLGLKRRACQAMLLSWNEGVYRVTSDLLFRNARKLMDAESDIIYTPTVVLEWFNGRKPTAISLHDIQQVHYPEFFSWSRRLSRRITYGLSARYASYVQASSHFTKQDLLKHYRQLLPDQIEVIPSGVTIERFAAPVATDYLSERYGVPERFLFCPAQLWPHKNHITILKALKQIEDKHGVKIPLIISGDKFPATPKEIFQFVADEGMTYVRFLGKVPSPDMVALHQKARFMITATLHESSSLPVLEAAAAGTPVIASRIPPIEELAQALRLNLFSPLDSEELARVIFSLWNDEQTAAAQAAYNRRQVAVFSWDNTARRYIQLFERVVGLKQPAREVTPAGLVRDPQLMQPQTEKGR